MSFYIAYNNAHTLVIDILFIKNLTETKKQVYFVQKRF